MKCFGKLPSMQNSPLAVVIFEGQFILEIIFIATRYRDMLELYSLVELVRDNSYN